MLFHAPEFLFAFLPITLVVFYLLSRVATKAAVAWLLAASVVFYAWWDWRYVAVLAASIAFNYVVGGRIAQCQGRSRRGMLWLGVGGNLLALALFKYSGFVCETINGLAGAALVSFPRWGCRSASRSSPSPRSPIWSTFMAARWSTATRCRSDCSSPSFPI